MKLAIVHDELVRKGGAEQVTLLLHKAFPDAPIYTCCYNPEKTYPEFKNCIVKTSWLNKFVANEDILKKVFYPLAIWAMKGLDLRGYDVVLISTTTGAKFVKISPHSTYISFCHYPFRLAWFPESYNEVASAKGIMKVAYAFVISRLKKLDYKAAKKMNWIITNTPEIAQIINQCYKPKNKITIISASIVCDNFYVEQDPTEDYYLLVSRIEPYKKVDLVIEAFKQMPGKKLIIVGKGSQKDSCYKMAGSNVQFLENISKEDLAKLYANCKAFIFPQKEDYGLTPIEANASGRPVIAYGKGGVTYTTVPYVCDSQKCTSVFFEEQTVSKIIKAIELAETLVFNSSFIRKHAENFDETSFINKIRVFVLEKHALRSTK